MTGVDFPGDNIRTRTMKATHLWIFISNYSAVLDMAHSQQYLSYYIDGYFLDFVIIVWCFA